MADDHAPSAISAYGSAINSTPNIDRLASQGMRFDRAYVTNSLCGPSRSAILTGQYSHINGYRTNGMTFDGSQQTYIKLLQKAGYQTAIVGKWHLGSDPTGFDFWSVLPGEGMYNNPQFLGPNNSRRTVQGYVVDIVTDMAIDWMEKRDKDKPFVLLCQHKAPHREWTPDAKHANQYNDTDIPTPPTFNDDYATRGRPAHEQLMEMSALTNQDTKGPPPAGLNAEQLKNWKYQRFIKDYLRVIASVDDNIGRLMDYLDKSGLTDNTIVVYTSDNGFFLGDHGWFDKRFMYEPGIRVPLIVRYPPKIKAGSSSKALAANIDYAETFLDYAGVSIPENMQGASLRPVLEGTGDKVRDAFYYHYYEFPQPHHVQPHAGVRTDRYKLIHFYFIDEWELYDLEKDPNELKNVYADPAYGAVKVHMLVEFERAKQLYKDDDFAPRAGSTPER